MSLLVAYNGQNFVVAQTGESPWGDDTTNYLVALASSLSKAGGAFTLTGEVDFGSSYGLKSLYYKSKTANISSTGVFRLANTDKISWRDSTNSADLSLSPNTSTDGVLQYNLTDLVDVSTTQTITNKTIDGSTPAEVARLAGLTGGTLESQLGVVRLYAYNTFH